MRKRLIKGSILLTSSILIFGQILSSALPAHSVEFGQDATGDPNAVKVRGGSGFLYSEELDYLLIQLKDYPEILKKENFYKFSKQVHWIRALRYFENGNKIKIFGLLKELNFINFTKALFALLIPTNILKVRIQKLKKKA